MLCTRTTANTEILKPTHGVSRAWIRHLGIALAFVLCFVIPARADLISGHVYGPDGKLLPNRAFLIVETNGRFKTDASGNFSVALNPGHYTVHPTNDNTLEGSISSYSQPVQQDIHLRKR